MTSQTGRTAPRHHRLAAVLAADVVGYTRLMELDEEGTHSRLMNLRFSVMQPIMTRQQGRIVKNTGDGFMAMFETAEAALQSAKDMQCAVTGAEATVPIDRRITFRMGVNVADVIVEDHDIYGDGVNIAARLQSHAEPGGIVISGLVAEHVGGTLGMHAVDLGQMHMRNLSNPVRVLSLRLADAPASSDLTTWKIARVGRARPTSDLSEATVQPLWVPTSPPVVLVAGYSGDLLAFDASVSGSMIR